MKTLISALAVAAALTAAPAFAVDFDVPVNGRNEQLATARNEVVPAQRFAPIAGQRFAPSFETSAQSALPGATVDSVR
jgi:hypothetical protein